MNHWTQSTTKNTSSDFNSAILFLIEDVREGALRKEPGPEKELECEGLCDESTFFRY